METAIRLGADNIQWEKTVGEYVMLIIFIRLIIAFKQFLTRMLDNLITGLARIYFAHNEREEMNSGDSGWSEFDGIKYHYEHVKVEEIIKPYKGKTYEVKTIILYTTIPVHCNTYYVPQERLDDFLREHNEVAEEIIHIGLVEE